MKNFIRKNPSLAITIIIVLLGITIYQCFSNLNLRKKLNRLDPEANWVTRITFGSGDKSLPDSDKQPKETEIRLVPTKFDKLDSYKSQSVPEKMIIWGVKDPTSLVAGQIYPIKGVTQFDSLAGNTSLMCGHLFIGLDSLVQFLLNRKTLELSFYNNQIDKYISSTYQIDLERYKYNWTKEKGLTKENSFKLTIGPYIQSNYFVFNKDLNISSGISFKTRKLEYNIGFLINHNPRIGNGLRPDLEVSVKYEFNKWLK